MPAAEAVTVAILAETPVFVPLLRLLASSGGASPGGSPPTTLSMEGAAAKSPHGAMEALFSMPAELGSMRGDIDAMAPAGDGGGDGESGGDFVGYAPFLEKTGYRKVEPPKASPAPEAVTRLT